MHTCRLTRRSFTLFVLLAALLLTPACGGGTSGADAGQGLIVTSFYQAQQDNVPINRRLRFSFSDDVDPASVGPASIQIREGDAFGLTASGTFRVDGSDVYFEPRLPTICGAADAGLRPGLTYRVTILGDPEAFSVRNVHGQPLNRTLSYEFATRPESDPGFLEDQIPATPPQITSFSPGASEAGVTVDAENLVRIVFSENLEPCSVTSDNVRFSIYELGDPGVNNPIPAGQPNEGNTTGFTPWDDQAPDSATSWGPSGTTQVPPQVIPAELILIQDFESTELLIRPGFGRFPENALCVVELTFGIEDFGGSPLAPSTYSFTTENLPAQSDFLRVEFDTTTESWPLTERTIDIDTGRSPGLAQGWMLFSGDGDNGTQQNLPSSPGDPSTSCVGDRQTNDGVMDDFDPEQDVLFDTGSTVNTCVNSVDGSTAVVWEFASFHIRPGVTVRFTGVNPAIILVQGEVLIESTGVLRTRADGVGGAPSGNGRTGYAWASSATAITAGGEACAGGGDGGDAAQFNTQDYGDDGWSPFGSTDGYTVQGGEGAGQGGSIHITIYPNSPGTSQGGGGGGHATEGVTSSNVLPTGHTDSDGTRGAGGEVVPADGGSAATRMLVPSAGGGGGAGGNEEWGGSYAGVYSTGGGSGGAGGGFVDITSSGNIVVHGTIDAAGGSGGSGGSSSYYAGPGGGGGGAGGGIRLITSGDIILGPSAVLTTAGGAGGYSPNGSSGSGGAQNHGGAGGVGRIVLEDQDAVIDGMNGATVIPADGDEGFYRGSFDPTRFRGGGLSGTATSGPILVGPLGAAEFQVPTAANFRCAIPSNAAIPPDGTGILIEAAGYPILADGSIDDSVGDHWYTIGYFATSGAPNDPFWRAGSNPPDVVPDNDGVGIHNLDHSSFLRFRLTVLLPPTVTPTTPGPWLDWMQFDFTYDR